MELEKKEEFDNLLIDNEVVLVFFYATWCPPCRMVKPMVEEYIENYPDNLIVMVNTDNIKDLHKKFDIHNVPSILCFKNNELVEILDGYIEYEELEEMFINLKS